MGEPFIINWAPLLDLRAMQPPDEPDIVEDLIRTFVEDSSLRLTRLREAAAAGNGKQVRLEAHAIKGSSSLMGADAVTDVAQAVESAAESGGAAPELIERLGQLLEDAKRQLIHGPPP
jgi:HPt (histidine-containing phosphotransfer) domain-containing protein